MTLMYCGGLELVNKIQIRSLLSSPCLITLGRRCNVWSGDKDWKGEWMTRRVRGKIEWWARTDRWNEGAIRRDGAITEVTYRRLSFTSENRPSLTILTHFHSLTRVIQRFIHQDWVRGWMADLLADKWLWFLPSLLLNTEHRPHMSSSSFKG